MHKYGNAQALQAERQQRRKIGLITCGTVRRHQHRPPLRVRRRRMKHPRGQCGQHAVQFRLRQCVLFKQHQQAAHFEFGYAAIKNGGEQRLRFIF